MTKNDVVAVVETIGIGKHRDFSTIMIDIIFNDRLDLGRRPHRTPQDAFLNSLDGDYSLQRDDRRMAYVIICHGKQSRYVEPQLAQSDALP
jgi:hypothetical protein